jgi:hypothetical protein
MIKNDFRVMRKKRWIKCRRRKSRGSRVGKRGGKESKRKRRRERELLMYVNTQETYL